MKKFRINLRFCSKLFLVFAGIYFISLNMKRKPLVPRNRSGNELQSDTINFYKKGYMTIAERDILKYLVPYNQSVENELCPLNILEGAPSIPYNPAKVINWLEFSKAFAKLLRVSAGGEWKPDNCISRFLVAIIVPVQNREQNLREFLLYMHPFLQRQNIHYKMYVIELASNNTFNRGLVLNAGFIEAMKDRLYPCVILHDVDSLPKYRNNIYACTSGLRLMVVVRDTPYRRSKFALEGGANAILSDTFKLVNGFSNKFFNWGKEDTDFCNRVVHKGVQIMRFDESISHYHSLRHKPATKNPERRQMLEEGKLFYHQGLNTTKYKMDETVSNKFEIPIMTKEKYLWFLKNGTTNVTFVEWKNIRFLKWSEEANRDPVLEQAMSTPEGYNENTSPMKTVLVTGHWIPSKIESKVIPNRKLLDQCLVSRCSFTANPNEFYNADAIVFLNTFEVPPNRRPKNQIWIYRSNESPHNIATYKTKKAKNCINWTATYRQDSDVPILYGKWIHFGNKEEETGVKKNYAANKTQKVAWVVSQYNSHNKRTEYAKELQKHISIDVYGGARNAGAKNGSRPCPRPGGDCFKALGMRYKFYLALENSNCKEYITEKLFYNALQHHMVPIVMGARPEDYASLAPPHSYIHVDDFASPKELAQFLHKLDADDDMYNAYFRWKETGGFVSPKHHHWCNLCAKLHKRQQSKVYSDLTKWLRHGSCIGPGKWPKND